MLFRFPQTDLTGGKLRPALLLAELPGAYDDWLICMISSQVRQYMNGFDEIIGEEDDDFTDSGLKKESAIRITRLAVVESGILKGTIGKINSKRLQRLKRNLAEWLSG